MTLSWCSGGIITLTAHPGYFEAGLNLDLNFDLIGETELTLSNQGSLFFMELIEEKREIFLIEVSVPAPLQDFDFIDATLCYPIIDSEFKVIQ